MSSAHDRAHREALLELAAAHEDARTAFERSALAGCAPCRAELEALLGVERELGALAADTRAAVEAGRDERDAPGEARVDAYLRGRLRAASPRRRISPFAWLAGTLAAGLLAFLALRGRSPSPVPDPGPRLHGGALELVSPASPAATWTEFAWRGTLPVGGWFQVRVRSAPDGAILSESDELHDPRWLPPAEQRASWPTPIYWEVLVYDDVGQVREARGAACSSR